MSDGEPGDPSDEAAGGTTGSSVPTGRATPPRGRVRRVGRRRVEWRADPAGERAPSPPVDPRGESGTRDPVDAARDAVDDARDAVDAARDAAQDPARDAWLNAQRPPHWE